MPRVRKPLEFITNDSICCEIGVWMGDFSKEILERKPKMLYLIDPWLFQSEFPGRWYGGKKAKTQNEMDTIYNNIVEKYEKFPNVHIIRKKSEDAFQIISDKFFDWIYIDGNHEYEFVLKDLENSRLKVKNNGYITGDDYIWKNNNGIKTVKKAVDEFVAKYDLDITIYPHGQFVIINKID